MTAPDPAADPTAAAADLTFAVKLDRVWKTMHPANRAPYTLKEVSAGVQALGVTASPSYLLQLRHGNRDNPTIRQVEALAAFFRVPMTYFFGTGEEVDTVDAQLTVVRATRSPAVRDLALRASSLTPAGLRAIAHIIDELQSVQGMSTRRDLGRRLPEPPPPSTEPDDVTAPAATAQTDRGRDTQPDPQPPSPPPPPARPRKRRG